MPSPLDATPNFAQSATGKRVARVNGNGIYSDVLQTTPPGGAGFVGAAFRKAGSEPDLVRKNRTKCALFGRC